MKVPLYKGKQPKCVCGRAVLYEKVGEGAWGKVRRCLVLPDLRVAACKVYYRCVVDRKLKGGYARLQGEFEMVSPLAHPNILQYFDIFHDDDKVYVIMEYCDGGSVESVMKGKEEMNVETVRSIMRQLLTALQYLHHQHIAHHDIKPGNLLITQKSTIKLADFTVAEQLPPTNQSQSSYGTPAYQSPEQLHTGDGDFAYDGGKADMWSAGIVLYQLVSGGRLPWRAETVYGVMREIVDAVEVACGCGDPGLAELLRGLLQKDPGVRMTATQALQLGMFTATPSKSCNLM